MPKAASLGFKMYFSFLQNTSNFVFEGFPLGKRGGRMGKWERTEGFSQFSGFDCICYEYEGLK